MTEIYPVLLSIVFVAGMCWFTVILQRKTGHSAGMPDTIGDSHSYNLDSIAHGGDGD